MMKKNGFTLAEVLITLAIIGVVATLTLPALIANTQEQQAKTALKKVINTLTEAAQMHQAVAGYSFADFTAEGDGSIDAFFKARTTQNSSLSAADKKMMVSGSSVDAEPPKDATSDDEEATTKRNELVNGYVVVGFRDGTCLLYHPKDVVANEANREIQDADGLPLGYTVYVDTNGRKGPNIVSSCVGKAEHIIDVKLEEQKENAPAQTIVTNASACDENSTRVIKDQFKVRLRGTFAQPGDDAAAWAFEN